MATHTSDIPLTSTGTKSRTGSENLEAEAIGLEVPVRIQGTQTTSVMGTTEHAEPFQEDSSTMIVFPRGAVVKLLARVRSGQSVELTNLRTNVKLPCKVFQVNSANNSVFYVKLEFLQPSQGFWGIHFPSDPPPVTRRQQSAPPAAEPAYSATSSFVDSVSISPAPPPSAPSRDIFAHASVPERPSAPLLNEKPEPPSPSSSPSPSPSVYASPFAPPVVPPKEREIKETSAPAIAPSIAPSPEAPKLDAPQAPSSPSNAPAYGPARTWQKEAIEPLAGTAATASVESAVAALVETPAPAAEKIPIPGRRPVPAPSKSDRRREKPVRPVFGELHSFNSAASASASPSLSSATLKMSSVSRPLPAPARSGSRFFMMLVTLCVLTVIAAGVMYARRHSLIFSSSGSANAAGTSAQSAPAVSEPPAVTPQQDSATAMQAPSSPVASSESSTATAPAVTPPPVAHPTFASKTAALTPGKPAPVKATSARAETHAAAADASTSSSESASDEVPNIYAGDLNARPEIKPRAAKRMDSQAPDIAASAPAGVSGAGSTALSSIVPAADAGLSAPAAPVAPEDAVRTGGKLQQPKLLSSVAPAYPPLARQNGVEGEVTIQATVGISGNVTSMEVISGPALLRDAAMNALRKWRYAPAKLDGKPISSQYVVTIRFRLNN